MRQIQWFGVGRREIAEYSLAWEFSGAVVPVEDDNVALDILTQPGEKFVDVTDDQSEVKPVEPTRTGKSRKRQDG